jgi:hypothetical protein
MSERAISHVPLAARLVLTLALGLQIAWQSTRPPLKASPEDLPQPPSMTSLRLASLGEPVALAKGLTLYLQSFDSQKGEVIPWRNLDFDRVQAWLGASLALDPLAQYPLFLASQVYSGVVGDEKKQRQMLAFVRKQFDLDPNRRWRWLTDVSVLARHRLKDLALAREYVQAVRLKATGPDVPLWAKQMEMLLLQDMNELETAKVMLGGLIQSGQVTQENELRFLYERLAEIDAKLAGKAMPSAKP